MPEHHHGRPQHPLAIVGMACRFPGAKDPDSLWELARSGACALAELPPERLDRELYSGNGPGKTYSALGGVAADAEGLAGPAADVARYDVAHRVFLQVAAEACAGAGWVNQRPTNVGVYVGHARTSPLPGDLIYATYIEECAALLAGLPEFQKLEAGLRQAVPAGMIERTRAAKPRRNQSGAPFATPGVVAALVSERLGFTGPSMIVDAACASSLVALSLAAGALREGRVEAAVVGGASFSNWESMALFARAQALSVEGSFPFDERACGFVSADGYAAVVVKTLERALADGDRVLAVVRGIGISSDGRGKSLWAPRKEGQIEAIRRAGASWRIDYVEAHGTSTQLGDATELQSLQATIGQHARQRIALGSIKGSVGHTCEAAGLAGLIKTVQALRHREIPPAANLKTPNPRIDWGSLPFYLAAEPLPWQAPADGGPRRAAVDSFGIGGLNATVVVEEANAAHPGAPAAEPEPIAIIGAGAVFPGARTLDQFWELLRSGKDPKTDAPAARWNADRYFAPEARPCRTPVKHGGFITDFQYDWRRRRIPPKQLEAADPLQFMLLDAADQALDDAGYREGKTFDRKRAAVVVGTAFSGDFNRQLAVALHYPEFERSLEQELHERGVRGEQARKIGQAARKAFHERWPALADETGSYSASTLASRIARTLDLMGGAMALDAGDASCGAALEAAADMLRSGACDLALCAAGQRAMDVTVCEELGLRGVFADGVEPGEGAGVVALKRLSDARRDGDRVRAVLRGIRLEPAPERADALVRQLGYSIAALGMAALLAELAPGRTGAAVVRHASPCGKAYAFELERPAAPARQRVAFLFSGQGSQRHGMLRDLIAQSPAARARLREVDETMARLGYPDFAAIAWNEDSGMGKDIWLTQISVLLADVIALAAAKEQGLAPDVVAGHSYGELAALVAAGAWTLEQAIVTTKARAESIEPGGALLATNAPQEAIERAAPGLHIAIRNAPGQWIAGGARAAVLQACAALGAAGFEAVALPVPAAFHTPLLAGASERFARALETAAIQPPAVAFLSSVTNRYVADPCEIRRNLAAQLSTPMDYAAMVRRLEADGVTTFVEIGPRQVLTRLNERILGAGGPVCFAIDDAKRRAPVAHFDATERRRRKNQERAAAAPAAPQPAAPEAAPQTADELTETLAAMICERTGYPRELVTPEADLEADLGLDSITRVQLAVELAERFQLGDIRNQRIQDFRTVRDIRAFLERSRAPQPEAEAEGMRALALRGAPYQMGLQHGRQRAAEIRRLLETYGQLLGGNVLERADLKTAMESADAYFGPDGLEELRGMAEASGLPLPLLAGFNLALLPEYLPGCSHFVARTPEGLIHGANEDAPLSMKLQLGAPAAMARRPERGLAHVAFGLAGQLAGINGMNEAGLVVTSTSLLDQAKPLLGSPGRVHQALVKELLEGAADVDGALERVRRAVRCGAWSLLLSHAPTGRACYVEYAAGQMAEREVDGNFAGANHSLLLAPAAEAPAHSQLRLQRLNELAAANAESARRALRDRYDGERQRSTASPSMNTVCRVDNLLSVVVEPERQTAWVAAGPRSDQFERLDLAELLDKSVMRRWALRMAEAPLAFAGTTAFEGAAFVLGDGPRAAALRTALEEAGCALAETCTAAVRHLFIANEDPTAAYECCRAWVLRLAAEGRLDGATLAALTALGGDFGLSGNFASAAGGGIAGLLKALRREFPALRVKVLDAPAEEPAAAVARAALRELAAKTKEAEVGLRAGKRATLRLVRRTARPRAKAPVSRGGVWVVSGGARGITACAAKALGARYGLRLHLLGRSAEAAVDFPATYHCCDVSDRAALAATLARIRAVDGPIAGVLHGAGVERSAPLERKQAADVRATLGAKVDGAIHLMELTAADPLEAFVTFGSVSGRFGGHGQADYSMASDWLAKLAQQQRAARPECACVHFHWPAWDEVGMSVRPASRQALETARQHFMPVAEGVARLLEELEAGAPEGEIVIIDGPGILDSDGSMQTAAPSTHGYPLLAGFIEADAARAVAEVTLEAEENALLRDHRLSGQPLLPGAMSAEAMAEAAAAAAGAQVAALRGVEFRRRLLVPEGKPVRARVEINGGECRLVTEFRNRAGALVDAASVVAAASVECGEPGPAPTLREPAGLAWQAMRYPDEGPLIHGPSLRVLQELAVRNSEGYGRILAPECAGVLPVAALDACLVACGAYAYQTLGTFALPHRVETLRRWRLPRTGELCLVHFELRERSASSVRFDFTLAGEDGSAILRAEGYEAAVMGDNA